MWTNVFKGHCKSPNTIQVGIRLSSWLTYISVCYSESLLDNVSDNITHKRPNAFDVLGPPSTDRKRSTDAGD
jgi:hypothetical protein